MSTPILQHLPTKIEASREDVTILADRFIALFNELASNCGQSALPIMGMCFALGQIMAHTHCIIDVNAPIVEAMPPLAMGYTEARLGIVN